MNQAFLFDLNTLEEFYKRCIAEEAVTIEEKNKILVDLMQEKKIVYLGQTEKSCPELATELIKKGVNAKSVVKGVKKHVT
jgi:hypothetical protein